MPSNYLKKYLFIGPTINHLDSSNSKILTNVYLAIQTNISQNKSDDLLKILHDYLQVYSLTRLKNRLTNRVQSNIHSVAFYLACCAKLSKNEQFTHKVYGALIEVSETPLHLYAFEHFWEVVNEIYANRNSSETSNLTSRETRKDSKHIGRGHKKALIKWFQNKNELDLIKLLTQYRHFNKWNSKDLLKLIHMKPKNEGQDYIMKYILYGYRRIQNETLPENFKNIAEYLHDFEKLKFIKFGQEATDLIRKQKFYLEHIPSRVFKFKEIWTNLIEIMNIQEFYENFHQILKKEIIRPNSTTEKFVFDKILNRNNPDYAYISPISNCLAAQIYEHYVTQKQLRSRTTFRPNNLSILEDKSCQDIFREYLWSAFKNTIQLVKSQSKSYFNSTRLMVVAEINPQMRNSSTHGLNYLSPLETSSAILLNLYYLNNNPANIDVFVASDRLTRIELTDGNIQAEPNLGSIDHIFQGFVSIEKNPTDKIFEWTLQNEKFYDVFLFLVSSDQNNKKIQAEMDFVRANTISKDTKLIVVNLSGKITETENEFQLNPSLLDLYLNGWNFETHHLLESFLKGFF